jgi:hypothetical protein
MITGFTGPIARGLLGSYPKPKRYPLANRAELIERPVFDFHVPAK